MMSVLGLPNISLRGLLMPETFARKYPATPSAKTTPDPTTLPALMRRRTGFCRRGKSCPPGGSLANDWPVVLCREKFTESLPFIVRQDADVAVHEQTGRLVC